LDSTRDGVGDVCWSDVDRDQLPDRTDLCPQVHAVLGNRCLF
jgi:hypothetical protein